MMSRKQTLASDVLASLEAKTEPGHGGELHRRRSRPGPDSGAGQLPGVPGAESSAIPTEVKSALLHVPETLLRDLGAVSGPVAEAMARGAQAALSADVAVSTTGLAGPWRGWVRQSGGDGSGSPAPGPAGWSPSLCRFQGNREEIREAACCRALGAWFWRL